MVSIIVVYLSRFGFGFSFYFGENFAEQQGGPEQRLLPFLRVFMQPTFYSFAGYILAGPGG